MLSVISKEGFIIRDILGLPDIFFVTVLVLRAIGLYCLTGREWLLEDPCAMLDFTAIFLLQLSVFERKFETVPSDPDITLFLSRVNGTFLPLILMPFSGTELETRSPDMATSRGLFQNEASFVIRGIPTGIPRCGTAFVKYRRGITATQNAVRSILVGCYCPETKMSPKLSS